jgi:uncharacterized damage-inducible protein DinB
MADFSLNKLYGQIEFPPTLPHPKADSPHCDTVNRRWSGKFRSRGEPMPRPRGSMHLNARIPIRLAGGALACCLLAASPLAWAQAAAPAAAPAKPAVGTQMSPSQTYGKLLSLMEGEFVGAAEAMPEDKYNFAPPATAGEFKGVRTFAEQVKHVADSNYYFFGGPNFTEADGKAKHDAIEKLTTKADILKALKESLAQAHTYVDGITPENNFVMTATGTRGGMAAFGLAHMMDHYGQMVVYLRMNGIVPPASRGGGM